jgi:erythromycin esterase-like protein
MAELDLVRLRVLAAALGFWPATTDAEHVARLRAQDARYDEQEAQDPDGAKWQKMMGAWVAQVTKLSVQERMDCRSAKYGHLRAAAAERAEEARRLGEANRRSKERPTGTTGDHRRCGRRSEGTKQ